MATPPMNSVDLSDTKQKIQSQLSQDTFISQFVKEGKKLLEETNRPNIITFAQFQPFMPLFNIDKELYIPHSGPGSGRPNQYTVEMNRLFHRWRHDLGINLHEVTYVIQSKEDPKILYYLDRLLMRIRSDSYEGDTSRSSIPQNVPRNAHITREDLIIDASLKDVMEANNTPDQIKRIQRLWMETAVINRNFTEKNQTPGQRPETVSPSAVTGTPSSGNTVLTITLDDDDE